MSKTGCCGKIFIGLNFIVWLLGFGVVGYGIWTLVTTGNTSNFLSGTLMFTYSFLGIGTILVITGLLGCIGGCVKSTCCLKAYIGLMVFILLVDIGVAIAGYTERASIFNLTKQLWGELNDDTKYHIQKELGCCGYNSTSEYTTPLPSTCFNDQGAPFMTNCKDAMEVWVKNNIPVWACILGGIGLIQILSTVTSCLTLKAIEEAMRVGNLDD